MANRNFPNSRLYSFHMMPVYAGCKIVIGASGAVSSFSGPGIAAVTKLATGIYQVQLQDNYRSLLHVLARMVSPQTGSNIADGSFSTGTAYQITAVGTTDWHSVGLPASLTPAIGQTFVALGAGGAGTGTAKVIGVSSISSVAVISDSSMLAPTPSTPLQGGFIVIQTLAATDATTTTLIPTNPASGSAIEFACILNNSSVQ